MFSPRIFRRFVALLLACGLATLLAGAAAAQTRVSNTATLRWTDVAGAQTLTSNTVTLDYVRTPHPTGISFRLLPPGYVATGAKCEAGSPPRFTPAPIDAATLETAPRLAAIDIGTPLIIVLDAPGQNHDPTRREQSTLQVQAGAVHTTLPLTETGVDSGIFAGAVPAVGMADIPELKACDLALKRGERFTLSFTGDDGNEASIASLLVDPAGYVFDSGDGTVVDGATVELIDLNGQPATVYGDDGVSRYPSTMVSGATVTDGSGRVYPGIPGRYRFPFAPPGQYRLRVTPPGGYTAPSIVGADAIALLRMAGGGSFIVNDASYGGVLTLATIDPFLADIPLDRQGSSQLVLTKTASVREAAPGDVVQYRLRVTNRGTSPARGLHIVDTLPPGLRYRIGSTRAATEPVAARDGRTLDFALPDLAPGASTELRYMVSIAPGAPVGEALNRATVRGAGVTSNEAAASVRLRPLLFTDALTVLGRVTEGACGDPVEQRIGVPGIRLLMEDGTFVVTDRDGLYHLEGVRPGTHVVQVDAASIPATHQAVACDVDTRQARNPLSRFVEGAGGTIKRVDFQLRPTGQVAAAETALPIAIADDTTAAGNRDWLEGQTAGIDWLFPQVGHNPRAPALRVVVKHHAGQRVALTLNGAVTEALAFDGTDAGIGAARDIAVSRWTGLPLVAGDNALVARVLNADGSVAATLERSVHFAGAPVNAVFDQARSRLVADGLTRALVAVRVTDAAGRPARAGTPVPFRVEQPYLAALDDSQRQARGAAASSGGVAHVVGDDGYAFLPLQPTTQAGAAQLTLSLADARIVRTVPVRAWLAASARDWVVIGFGKGSVGYETLRRHGKSLPRQSRDRVVTDGQLALYAKGRVKGSWLLTIAYDSDRPADRERGLLGTIDRDRYYTVYGDGSDQRYDAATRRKLFLRLERRQFYALFGDFETGMIETQLTRYSRTLNGAKAAYEGDRVRATGFVATTDTLYARDEIQGNGLSGPYRLSRRGIVANSDKLTIQVRDRFRSEVVKSSTPMTRHIDYDIDLVLGTIRFRQPVLSRDGARDPVFIVVDYEVEGGRAGRLVAAGRVATRLFDRRLEIGAAAIRDETLGIATVAGVDLKLRAGRGTEVRGELAGGGRGGLGGGVAYLAEVEHHDGALDVTAYVRRQDAGFGVGQQNLVEAGTRKTGFDGRIALTPALTLAGTGWYQEQLVGQGRRTAGETRLEWRRGATTVFAGGQLAMDRGVDGSDRDSQLLTLGGSRAFFADRLLVTGQTQVAPGGDRASVDFPVRHQLTAAFRVTPGVRLIGGYEIAEGADFVAHTAQVGFDVAPWRGGKASATLNGQAAGENGDRTFAQYGLSQSLPLGPRWTIDATLDATTTVSGAIAPGAVVNAFQPVASGGFLDQDARGGSFAAITFGGAYRGAAWSWNGRIEYRDADATDRLGVTSNLIRTLGEGRTLASSVKAYRVTAASGAVAAYAAGDLALAWRPLDSRWSVLERLELRHERADAGFTDGNVLGVPAVLAASGSAQVTTRVVNNLALNWRSGPEGLGHGTEATVYYGAKYVAGRFAQDQFDGYIDATGFELRQDLGTRVDIGVQGSVSHAWDSGTWSWSAGPSVGVSPARDVWISAGYNVAGYRDRDFEDDRYTRAGPYITLRMKFDRATLGQRGRR